MIEPFRRPLEDGHGFLKNTNPVWIELDRNVVGLNLEPIDFNRPKLTKMAIILKILS